MLSETTSYLKKFFKANSVAIIGASTESRKVGNIILKNFVENFKGKVYPVNPKANEILNLKCYASVRIIPDKVDLAVVAVPAANVSNVLKDCGEKGIKAIIIITAGFSEAGATGVELEKKLLAVTKKYGIRFIGPNCMGIFDTTTRMDTLFLPQYRLRRPVKGRIGFLSQSGASGIAFLDWAAGHHIGMSKFVSYGNASDIGEADLLEYFAEDPETKVVIMYVEGVKEGEKFLKAAKKAAKIKPIIVLKAGSTYSGAKAAKSHVGALAGSDTVFDAVVKQAGLIRVYDWEEIFDIARALVDQPPAKGNRVAVITNGGGAGVMTADEIEKQGLKLAELSEESKTKMWVQFPPHIIIENPVDLTGDTNNERYRFALETILEDANADSVILISVLQTPLIDLEFFSDIFNGIRKYDKPVVACFPGGRVTWEVRELTEEHGIPTYPTPVRAVRAIKALTRYGKTLSQQQ